MPEYFAISELSDFELWLDALETKQMHRKDPAAEQYFVAEVKGEIVVAVALQRLVTMLPLPGA
jgi:hypothetical protein